MSSIQSVAGQPVEPSLWSPRHAVTMTTAAVEVMEVTAVET